MVYMQRSITLDIKTVDMIDFCKDLFPGKSRNAIIVRALDALIREQKLEDVILQEQRMQDEYEQHLNDEVN